MNDVDANLTRCVFNARNVNECALHRAVCTQPIPELFIEGRGGGADSLTAMLGGTTSSPLMPGPVQLYIDVPEGVHTAEITADVTAETLSAENAPDLINNTPAPQTPDIRLLYRIEQPVEFTAC